jgi:UDP-N-acetylmuramoylalanine--D-glutamate ligase
MKFEGRCNLNTITSQTDLFLQVYHDMTIAVTGTKGKSTTTTLIHHILSHTLGSQRHIVLAGNMGIPLFDILDQLDELSLIVAEFSCHQLENIHRAPHIGVILNLYQEHLDHYHDYHDYQMAKMQMMLRQESEDHCFYCTDSQDLVDRVAEVKTHVSTHLHPYSYSSNLQQLPSPLKGKHNLSNIAVAQQVTSLLGITADQFSNALNTFHGLPHRLELVGTFNGITFYNDSISTIPDATLAAVEALERVDTLILGGFDRGIDYTALANYLSDPEHYGKQVSNLVFVGQAGARMLQEWTDRPDEPIQGRLTLVENDYDAIVRWCYQHTQRGRICLLSPAAASYDAFRNFEHRGDTFKSLILQYANQQ